MLFAYKPTSGDAINGTNPALGVVVMATEYNSNLPNFTNKVDMENHEYTTSGSPADYMLHPIECARNRTPVDELYVRPSSTSAPFSPVTFDPLLYDLGNFQIATVGHPADGSTVGELWVTYEIEFLKPASSSTTPTAAPIHYYLNSAGAGGGYPGTVNFMQGLKNAATGGYLSDYSKLPIPPGKWVVIIHSRPNSGTFSGTWSLGFSNCSLFNFTNATSTGASQQNTMPTTWTSSTVASGSQDFQYGFAVDAGTASNAYVYATANMPITGSGWAYYDVHLFPLPNAYAASRRAIDYDPIARLYRMVTDLQARLECPPSDDEKDHYLHNSECSTPLHVEPDVTQSTSDLAESLLTRLAFRRGAVTQKTAHTSAA
jgi:hypothetical protein